MNQNLLNDICLRQLTLSGVHEGETISVLTQGEERGDYADASAFRDRPPMRLARIRTVQHAGAHHEPHHEGG